MQRWCLLAGNLFFYCKDEEANWENVIGLVILERCQVETDSDAVIKYGFRLFFDDDPDSYWFMANTGRDSDEWIRSFSCASYEYLRTSLGELRGQLMQITGKDPLIEGHPFGDFPVKNTLAITASAPGLGGEALFELTLACSSLVGSSRDSVPSTLIVTSCMTPPQMYWIRYAQTEVVESNCDPRFFTTVVFYKGTASMATNLKFEVFDVYDKVDSKMVPMGQAQCKLMDLVRTINQSLRLEIVFNGSTCGFLHIKLCTSDAKQDDMFAAAPIDTELQPEVETSSRKLLGNFLCRPPLDNIVMRKFEFPTKLGAMLDVTEVMGEIRTSFSIPIILLERYIAEETTRAVDFESLTDLKDDWEIARQDILKEHWDLTKLYRDSQWKLTEAMDNGMSFKKSTSKAEVELDFVPVNLHVQEMRVALQDPTFKDRAALAYVVVTAGCPTAYGKKYRQGGLARMQPTSAVSSAGIYRPSTDSKASRAQGVLGHIDVAQRAIRQHTTRLLEVARAGTCNPGEMQLPIRSVADTVHQLSSHCNVTLVNDALKNLHEAMANPPDVYMDANAYCQKIKEHVLSLEALVDNIVYKNAVGNLQGSVDNVLEAFDATVVSLKKALYFVLLRESRQFLQEKVPLGPNSYTHRRDIVFSQAMTSVVYCFMEKVLHCLDNQLFVKQISSIGFLIYWESLLSTQGDEIGMLEDFIVAIHDVNTLQFKLVLAEDSNDSRPRITGTRYKFLVEVPLQETLYRILPIPLQNGKVISITAVMFTQGINEQQSYADILGNNTLQDLINNKSFQQMRSYCLRYTENFGISNSKQTEKARKIGELLEHLRVQVSIRKAKNTDILTLSQELSRVVDAGRITSCKSAKDRTAMSVTLEQAHILLREYNMDPECFQKVLDDTRSHGTRIRNTEKNIGIPQYAFNSIQVLALPKNYRPPEGTYKKAVPT